MPSLASEQRPRDRRGRGVPCPWPLSGEGCGGRREAASRGSRMRIQKQGAELRGGRAGGGAEVSLRNSASGRAGLWPPGSPGAQGGAPSCLRTPVVTPACPCSLSALAGCSLASGVAACPAVTCAVGGRPSRLQEPRLSGSTEMAVPARRLWGPEWPSTAPGYLGRWRAVNLLQTREGGEGHKVWRPLKITCILLQEQTLGLPEILNFLRETNTIDTEPSL